MRVGRKVSHVGTVRPSDEVRIACQCRTCSGEASDTLRSGDASSYDSDASHFYKVYILCS